VAPPSTIRSEFGDGFLKRLLVSASNGDLGAFRNEQTGRGKTDAAVASGDESFFPCEFHSSPSLRLDSGASNMICVKHVLFLIVTDGRCG
jgi:hypothetical protein